jgi:hypothetical protein
MSDIIALVQYPPRPVNGGSDGPRSAPRKVGEGHDNSAGHIDSPLRAGSCIGTLPVAGARI